MNPYAMLTPAGHEARRRQLVDELQHWHDEMVMHQRIVRLGEDSCSDDCPHAEGRRLWRDAKEILGPEADRLTFLRRCAEAAPPRPVS